jgi:hypothetical protein
MQNLFDLVYIGSMFTQYINTNLTPLLKSKAEIIVEGSKFLLFFTDEQRDMYLKKLDELVKNAQWQTVKLPDSKTPHAHLRFKWDSTKKGSETEEEKNKESVQKEAEKNNKESVLIELTIRVDC